MMFTKEAINEARQALVDTGGYIESIPHGGIQAYAKDICSNTTAEDCVGVACLNCLLRGLDKLEVEKPKFNKRSIAKTRRLLENDVMIITISSGRLKLHLQDMCLGRKSKWDECMERTCYACISKALDELEEAQNVSISS